MSSSKPRLLGPTLFKELTSSNGRLKELLLLVQKDHTLDMQIRNDTITIYYRGGMLLYLTENALSNFAKMKGKLFNQKYLAPYRIHYAANSIDTKINSMTCINDFLRIVPELKTAMDLHFGFKQCDEREFQQMVVRENNFAKIANGTDYFIIDTEYSYKPVGGKQSKFDLVALRWHSDSSNRRLSKNYKPRLCFIEVKYGDGALSNKAGIKDHLNDFETFLNTANLSEVKAELINLFTLKRKLGLIKVDGVKNVLTDVDNEIEFAFLLINHDPESKKLLNEFTKLPSYNFPIKMFTSNFLGYGLYEHGSLSLAKFISDYKDRI
jgi:hypothetical protein